MENACWMLLPIDLVNAVNYGFSYVPNSPNLTAVTVEKVIQAIESVLPGHNLLTFVF